MAWTHTTTFRWSHLSSQLRDREVSPDSPSVSETLSALSGSTVDSHVGFVAINRGSFWEVTFRSGQLNPQHAGTNEAPLEAVQPILNALAEATGMPVVRSAS